MLIKRLINFNLNKETLEVQKRFLMIRNGEQESAYAQSLCSNCIEASREIIKLYNKNKNSQAK